MSHATQTYIAGLLSLIALLGIAILLNITTPQGASDTTYPVQPALLDASGQPDPNARDWR